MDSFQRQIGALTNQGLQPMEPDLSDLYEELKKMEIKEGLRRIASCADYRSLEGLGMSVQHLLAQKVVHQQAASLYHSSSSPNLLLGQIYHEDSWVDQMDSETGQAQLCSKLQQGFMGDIQQSLKARNPVSPSNESPSNVGASNSIEELIEEFTLASISDGERQDSPDFPMRDSVTAGNDQPLHFDNDARCQISLDPQRSISLDLDGLFDLAATSDFTTAPEL